MKPKIISNVFNESAMLGCHPPSWLVEALPVEAVLVTLGRAGVFSLAVARRGAEVQVPAAGPADMGAAAIRAHFRIVALTILGEQGGEGEGEEEEHQQGHHPVEYSPYFGARSGADKK